MAAEPIPIISPAPADRHDFRQGRTAANGTSRSTFCVPSSRMGGLLTSMATVTHRGRSIAVVSCEILNEAGKQVAVAGETILVLPGRQWDRPVYVADEALAAAPEAD